MGCGVFLSHRTRITLAMFDLGKTMEKLEGASSQVYYFALKRVAFGLLFFCVIAAPVNIPIIASLRLLDLGLLAFLVVTLPFARMRALDVLLFVLFFFAMLASSYVALIKGSDLRVDQAIFFYKYAIVFLIPAGIVSIGLTKEQTAKLMKACFVVYLAMVIWVYVYVFWFAGEGASSKRVGFPSTEYDFSDAHLFSSYLAMNFLFYLAIWKGEYVRSPLIRVPLLVAAVGALILTGSRTGIVTVGLGVIGILLLQLAKIIKKYDSLSLKPSNIWSLLLVILCAFSLLIFFHVDPRQHDTIVWLIERATNFALTTDQSALSRVEKLGVAYEDLLQGGVLLGSGPLGMSRRWYDNGIAAILASSGVVGFIAFSSLLGVLVFRMAKISRAENTVYLKRFYLLLVVYIFSNIITEYFLVSRNYFAVVVVLSLMVANLKQGYVRSFKI